MGVLWAVARVEAVLLLRGRGLWLTGFIMAALGALAGSMARQTPWAAWGHIGFTATASTLLLAFASGDQIRRDRAQRLDGVLLSTPAPTAAYVVGKYLAALAALLGLAGIGLAAALLTDRFDAWGAPPAFLGRADFPPLGAGPYLAGWGLLVVVPLAFGAALALAATTLLPGARTAAAFGILALWLLPLFVAGWPALLDVTGVGAGPLRRLGIDREVARLASEEVRRAGLLAPGEEQTGRLPAAVKAHLAGLARAAVPPRYPAGFWWNRAFFLGASAALVALTTYGVGQRRQGRW